MATQIKTSKPGSGVSAYPPGFADNETIDLFGILGGLKRRKWLILTVTALGTAIAAVLGMTVTPGYSARAAVMIDPRQVQVTTFTQVLGDLPAGASTIATHIGLLQSRTFVAKVMDDLHLFDDPEFNPALNGGTAQASASLPSFLQPLETVISRLPNEWLIATGLASQPQPVLESEAPKLTRERAITNFFRNVVYTNEDGSYLINISFTSPDRDKAAVIANRIAELYVEDQLKTKQSATGKASVWLEQRLAELREEVRQSDQAVEKYKIAHNIVEAAGTTLSDTNLGDLNKELITARADLAQRQAKLRLVRDLRAKGGDALESIGEVTSSPLIIRLREEQVDLARQESELRTLYGDRHPRMVQLADEKNKVLTNIRVEVDRVLSTLDNDVRVAQTRVSSIEGQLGGLKTEAAQNRQANVELQELERVATSNRTLYEQLLGRFKETSDQQGIIEPDARVVAMAAPPVSPSTPGAKLFAAGGFTISFLLGSLLALLLDRLDRGLRSAREVENALGLTTLGLVPRVDRLRRNQRPHQYLREKPLSSYAEAIRGVHTALKLSNPGNPPKAVLVTSSLPEEGKTTLAVSFASLVARSQKRVLLIDLDLRHPSVHRELGWQVSAGLVEYMAGERTLQEVIHNDLETGLHFLPVKATTTTPTDLLESEKMRQLMQVCRENYDLIVIDSAPVASVNDTKVAAALADKIVFVVHWGKTIESAARDSLKSLRDAGLEPAGVVLTQIDLRKHAKYGYGDIGQYYPRSRRYYVN